MFPENIHVANNQIWFIYSFSLYYHMKIWQRP